MSIFAGLSRDVLQANLTAAQMAYMELASGAKVASASYTQGDGAKAVTYRQADIGQLLALIAQLQNALGMGCGRRRPIRFRYTH